MLPVVLGLALAIPLAALTAKRGDGLALRRLGLLRIPEERLPPAVLARAAVLQHEHAGGARVRPGWRGWSVTRSC